jgi:undecaprenyl-diphosphatase
MEIFQAIILGIIEGLTEFLPISSTGHLIVAEEMLGFKDQAELFTVVIQSGAIAAVIWFYRRDILGRLTGKIKGSGMFWFNLAIATLPAGFMGLILDRNLQKIATPSTVAWMLILGGIVLWLVEMHHRERKNAPRTPHYKPEARLDDITPRQALGIGAAQTIALIPGVSRSGASIVGGMLSGLDRVTATAFSFYMSIPVIILASAYKLVKEGDAISLLPGGSPALIAGVLAAFVTALLAVSWLLRYISHHDFKGFAYYRIVLGVILLLLIATRFIR